MYNFLSLFNLNSENPSINIKSLELKVKFKLVRLFNVFKLDNPAKDFN